MSKFESIEDELKFMADCSDNLGDSETSLMFVRYLAHIRKMNAELAALKVGQGEAVAIAECREVHGHMCQFLNRTQHGMDTLRDGDKLYTAPPATADARLVPVELLERIDGALTRHMDGHAPMRVPVDIADSDIVQAELRALLAQSQEVKS